MPNYLRLLPLALVGLFAFSEPAIAEDRFIKDKEERPEADDDERVEKALETLEKSLENDDMDRKLQMIAWFGKHRHDDVIKMLRKLYLKEKNIEIIGAAAQGFGNQLHDPKRSGKVLLQGLRKYQKLAGKEVQSDEEMLQENLEAKVIVNTVRSIAALQDQKTWDKAWKEMKGLIDHNNDEVAIAVIQLSGQMKEYRALPIIKNWFHHYPDGASWSGGSVRVDTGAAGNRDARAAKSKWQGRYGNRAKKARPNAFKEMVIAVKLITGVEIKKKEELEAWMHENKKLLKKHGV